MLSLLTPYACMTLATFLLNRQRGHSLVEAILASMVWPVSLGVDLFVLAHQRAER